MSAENDSRPDGPEAQGSVALRWVNHGPPQGWCLVPWGPVEFLSHAIEREFSALVRRGLSTHPDPRGCTEHEVRFEMVYALVAEGLGFVKVGYALNARERLKTLQAGCPVPLILWWGWAFESFYWGGRWCSWAPLIERAIHRGLIATKHARRSEWFAVSPRDLVSAVDMALLAVPELDRATTTIKAGAR